MNDKALKYMIKSLYYMNILGGEVYAECIVSYVNIANIYMDKNQH